MQYNLFHVEQMDLVLDYLIIKKGTTGNRFVQGHSF